jgi:hypothetical protein
MCRLSKDTVLLEIAVCPKRADRSLSLSGTALSYRTIVWFYSGDSEYILIVEKIQQLVTTYHFGNQGSYTLPPLINAPPCHLTSTGNVCPFSALLGTNTLIPIERSSEVYVVSSRLKAWSLVVKVESAMHRSSAGDDEVEEMLSEEPGDNCSQMSLEVCLFRLMFIVSGVSRCGLISNKHERMQSH